MRTSSQILSLDDPIVDEIRQIRAELAQEANYDLHAMCKRIREQERQHSPEGLLAPSPPAGQPSS